MWRIDNGWGGIEEGIPESWGVSLRGKKHDRESNLSCGKGWSLN